MTAPDTEDMTELVDARFDRVDLVGKAANGTAFLIRKAQEEGYGGPSLFEADFVRSLVQQSTDGQEASMTATTGTAVVKADEDLDAGTVLAEPEGSAPGSDTDPGSPAWEAIDAASARKWTAILARAKNALGTLADRENIEISAGGANDGDWMTADGLTDAQCAIDYAIGILAPYAVAEQAEADLGAETMAGVAKSLGAFDVADLDLIEGLAPIVKAGRTLSSANESAIRAAVTSLQNVLASLPAPTPEPAADAVAKETTMTGTSTVTLDGEPIKAAVDAALAKAKGDPQMAVYDANGKLVGVIAQTDLNPIAAPEPPADAPTADEPAEPAADPAAAVDPAATLAPADANDGPAADLTKSTDAQTELLKGIFATALNEALTPLQERIANMEAQPMPGGPMLNGQTPGANPIVVRGDGEGVDLAKAWHEEKDPIRKQELQMELAAALVGSAPRLQ